MNQNMNRFTSLRTITTSHTVKSGKENLLKQRFIKTLPQMIKIGANLNRIEFEAAHINGFDQQK